MHWNCDESILSHWFWILVIRCYLFHVNPNDQSINLRNLLFYDFDQRRKQTLPTIILSKRIFIETNGISAQIRKMFTICLVWFCFIFFIFYFVAYPFLIGYSTRIQWQYWQKRNVRLRPVRTSNNFNSTSKQIWNFMNNFDIPYVLVIWRHNHSSSHVALIKSQIFKKKFKKKTKSTKRHECGTTRVWIRIFVHF